MRYRSRTVIVETARTHLFLPVNKMWHTDSIFRKNRVPQQLYLQEYGTEFSKHRQKSVYVYNVVRLPKNSLCVVVWCRTSRSSVKELCKCRVKKSIYNAFKSSTVTGLEWPRMFPYYVTSAQDDGEVSPTHRPSLPPRNAPDTYFC